MYSPFIILQGIGALMWVAVWQIMVSDTPETDNHISNAERNMILQSLEDESKSSNLVRWTTIIISYHRRLPTHSSRHYDAVSTSKRRH